MCSLKGKCRLFNPSELDEINYVKEALNEASIGRTTIMIAHRLSTLKNAHVIYVIDKGIVAEQGETL